MPDPKRPNTGKVFAVFAAITLFVAAGLGWHFFWAKASSISRAQATATTPSASDSSPGKTESSHTASHPTSASPAASSATGSAAIQGSSQGAVRNPSASVTKAQSIPVYEPEAEIDLATHYILINGHRAHPSRLLAKYKSAEPNQARETQLEQLELQAKHIFPLTPKLVLLKSTKATPSAVANEQEAKALGDTMQDRIKALMASGQFDYVEPDFIRTIDVLPTDRAFTDGTLWGLSNTGQSTGVAGADIDAVRAWDTTTGSSDVIVAVIDTGIRYTHQDLTAQMWQNPGEIPSNGIDDDNDGYVDNVYGINAITNSGDPADDNGHGTHTSGTIGASANSGGQHVGVAWSVKLMACKFLSSSGNGVTSDAVKCINFAVSKGARVLSNSWGGGPYSQALYDAIAAARDNGVLFVAAAGNDGENNDTFPHYPSSYSLDNIIAVAALDRQDKLASFSDYGLATVHVGAPGVSIFSCTNVSDSSYATLSGTSMATPHVSGVAALVLANAPDISVSELRQRILGGAVPISALTGKATSGGRLNAYNALNGSADGVLEVAVNPSSGVEVMGGTAASFFVQVRDYTAVTNATVTATLPGGEEVIFKNDGSAPDALADDNIYSASIAIPSTGSSLSLQITISAPDKTSTTIDCAFPIRLPPTNDNFAARTAITGSSTIVTGTSLGATKETGEPNHAGMTGGKSVWWSWTATTNGTITISTNGSGFDTVLGVYTGTSLTGLTSVASDDDSGSGLASLVSFPVTNGTTYQIAVDGYWGDSGGITLNTTFISAPVPPANDNFASAATLTGMNPTATGDNRIATKETGEPNHAGNTGGHSVWWAWTAPVSGIATVSTDGSLFDTTLGVYVGTSVSSLTTVGSDNDSGEGSRSQVSFSAEAGTIYYLAVDGYGSTTGSIALAVSLVVSPPTPVNDNFDNRITITGASTLTTATNIGATKEAGEADHAQNSGGKSVWWTWTAPTAGTVTINTLGSNFDTLLAVYTGSSLSSLTTIASNDQDPLGGNTSRVIFNVSAGTTYQITVDGMNNGLNIALGSISLNIFLSNQTLPSNDLFAYRTPIVGVSATVTGSNIGATTETGEPTHYSSSANKSVWWSWTATTTGTAVINTDGSPFDTVLAVYTGSAINALTSLGSDDDSGAGLDSQIIFSATAGTTYQIAVAGLSGSSGSITLNVNPVIPPPLIGSSPINQSRYVGDSVSFSVSATSSTPMTYQWKKDGVNLVNSTYISGATSSYLNISSTLVADSGQYTVVVTNTSGSSVSLPATLAVTIPPAPVISSHPPSQSIYIGQYISLSVGASSLGRTTYQWQKSTDNGTTFTNIAYSNSSYFSISFAQSSDAGQYRVIITNPGGTVTSNVANVTVTIPPAPVITTQPVGQSLYINQSLYLSVSVSNTGTTTYQWQKSTDNGTTFANIAYATGSNFSIYSTQLSDAGQYRVTITNSGGTTTSNIATVTVSLPPPPVITTQPVTQSIYLGQSLNLSVVVTNTGSTTYQWQKSTDNGLTFTNIAYATYSNFYISPTQLSDAAQYRVIITNLGGSTTSNAATITFSTPPPPVIGTQPSNQTVYLGESIYFYAWANNTGTTTYQWQKSIDSGLTYVNIVNATNSSLNISPSQLSDAALYRVIVTNPGGSTTSNSATVTFLTPLPPTISTQPTGTTLQAGSSIYLYGYASGRGNVTYQWQKDGVNLVNDTHISGATSNNLSIYSALLADAGQYRFVATNAGGSVTSNSVTVAVTAPPPPTISSNPASNTVYVGNSTYFYVYASGTGLRYQWQKDGVNLVNDTRISGATNYSLTINNTQTTDAGQYRVIVANEGGSVTSTTATLTVTIPAPPSFYTQPADITVLEGSSLSLYGYANSANTYQWYKDSTLIPGATSSTYSKTNATLSDAGRYKIAATNGGGTTYSREAIVTITPATAPVFVIQPQSQAAYPGDSVTLTAAATANPVASYQWFKNGTALSGATTNTLTISNLSTANEGETYTVRASNLAGNVTSSGATLTIYAISSGKALSLLPATRIVGCGRVIYPLSLRIREDWTATTNANWIQLSATSGSNSRSLEVIVAPNPLPVERTTTITIGQQTHTLTQRAAGTAIRELWAVGANDFGQLGDYRLPPSTVFAPADSQVQAIAAGQNHTLYLKTDGTLMATGDNGFGQLGTGTSNNQPFPVQIASSVKAIAAGASHSVILKQDGTLWTVGLNTYGQLGSGTTTSRNIPTQIATDVTAIAAGASQTFYIKSDTTLWAMGNNSYGQLGNGTSVNRLSPVQIATNVLAVASGLYHTLFVKVDGTLWATGYNSYGQLGDSTYTSRLTPVQVSTNVKAIACGSDYSLLLKNDNSLYGVGSNNVGQLGLGTYFYSQNTPTLITSSVQSMAAGYYHSLFVKTDGSLWVTGENTYAKLGNGNMTNQFTPVNVASSAQSAAAGADHSLLIKTDGTLWAAGANFYGQIGNASPGLEARTTPICVASEVQSASAGDNHSLFVKTDGTLWTVGDNSSGQLADGSTITRFLPLSVATSMSAAGAGYNHSFLLKSDGTLLAAGNNSYGQIGGGITTTYRASPIRVATDIAAIAAGSTHSFLQRTDGKLLATGNNGYGQLGDNAYTLRTSPYQVATNARIAAAGGSGSHSLLVKTDNTLWVWGNNSVGQLGLGSTFYNTPTPTQFSGAYQAVAAGNSHSLLLKTDNTLWATGSNNYGQLGNSSIINQITPVQVASNVQTVAAGQNHSLWIKTDNTLWATGDGSSGQLGTGTYSTRSSALFVAGNVQSISAGGAHSLFIASGDIRTSYTPPVITDFTPAAPTAGTSVTINGSGFNNVLGVYFNNVPATSFTTSSSSQIVAVVPTADLANLRVSVGTFDGVASGDNSPTNPPSSSSSSSGGSSSSSGGGGGGGAPGLGYLTALVVAVVARRLTLLARRR